MTTQISRLSRALLGTSIAALSLAIPAVSVAQSLSGFVTDSTGQAPFEGAVVRVLETGRTVTTNRFGAYRLNNLEPGTYTISVEYLGTETLTQTIVIPAEGASIDFEIGADVAYEDNIIVVGTKAAQASALNQQRAANSILTVIDSDGLGNFPDTTVADSLSRAVGLSVETDQGEGRYVSIRGINTDLISSSINGVRTPSPEDRRGVLLDGVPSDLLDGIEVQKSLTPDVDADSLGGVINLKTISAFDRKDRFARAKVETAFNSITDNISPKASLTLSDTWNDTFGAAVSFTYQDLAIESHNNEVGEWDSDNGQFFINDDFEQRWYDLTRERIGLVANFDWYATDNTKLFLRTLYNRYTDDEVRNKFEFRDLEDPVSVTANGASYEVGEVDAEVRRREEVRNIQTYSVGGETIFDAWTFDYQASYAYAEEDDSDNHDVNFRSDDVEIPTGAIIVSFDDPQQPLISGPALPFLLDPSNYELDTFEREFTVNKDTEYGAEFNAARDSLIGDTPVVWKAGAKIRDRKKTRDENLVFYERGGLTLDNFIRSDAEITNWRLINRMFEWPDADLTEALRGTFDASELVVDDTILDSSVGDFRIDERILAAYGMGTFEIGDATLVAGVRVEQTEVDLLGNNVDTDTLASSPREVSRDYTDVLPSINLRYDFTDRVIGRAAYYAAVVRPSFGEMAPSALLNVDVDEDENTGETVREIEVELGNPNLEPYSADNFDIGLEFYPTNLSVISVGAFYKSIDNAIFDAEFVSLADVPDGIDLSFLPATTLADITNVSSFINVGSSKILGVEFNYVQNVGDLSDALDGFIFSTNLTLTDSESTLPEGREVPFLKQSDTVWNIALAYDKGPWDLRVSGNYRGDFLDELQGEDLDRYTDDRFRVDASAKYRISRQLQVYLEGRNLTDAPEYYYFGDESRLSQYDEFGRTVVVGARFTY